MKNTNNKAKSGNTEELRARIEKKKAEARERIDRAEIEEQKAKRRAQLLQDLKTKAEEIATADTAERLAIHGSGELEKLEQLGELLEGWARFQAMGNSCKN